MKHFKAMVHKPVYGRDTSKDLYVAVQVCLNDDFFLQYFDNEGSTRAVTTKEDFKRLAEKDARMIIDTYMYLNDGKNLLFGRNVRLDKALMSELLLDSILARMYILTSNPALSVNRIEIPIQRMLFYEILAGMPESNAAAIDEYKEKYTKNSGKRFSDAALQKYKDGEMPLLYNAPRMLAIVYNPRGN
jgi:hypothetical protein